jgi:hypothetical protein
MNRGMMDRIEKPLEGAPFSWLSQWKIIRFIKGNFTRLELFEIVFLFALGLVVFTWYSPNQLVNTFDYGFSFAPERTLVRSLHLWDQYGGIGLVSPRAIAGTLPTNIYYAFMQNVGFSLYTSQSLLFYVILTGSGVSAFLLYRALGFGERFRNGAIFAAILYMFSPIASTFIWNQMASNYYSYCFIPLIAAMVVYGIRTRRGSLYILAVVLTWTLLISASYMNPLHAVMDWLLIAGLVLAFFFKEKSRRKQVIKFAVLMVTLWLVFNLFWIVPSTENATTEFAKADVSIVGVSNSDLLRSNSVPIYAAALQTGYWALYDDYKGDHWFSWWELASSVFFIASCLIIAITALYALFIKPRNPVVLLLGGFTVLCLIMINGYYPPTGYLLVGLFDQFPDLYAFRSLFQRFGPLLALCYAMFLGYSMANLAGKISWPGFPFTLPRKLTRKAWGVLTWMVLVVLALSVVAIPYFTGQIIYSGGEVIPSAKVQVPDYYYQANDYLNSASGDFRVMALPYCQIGYAAYSWKDGYWAADPSSNIFDRVIMTTEYDRVNQMLVDIAVRVANDSLNFDLGKMLSIMNVRYVMLHEDANWAFIYQHLWWAASTANYTMYDNGLQNAGMKPVATFDKLHLYENPSWRDVHYFQANQTLAVVGGLGAVKNLTKENWYDVSSIAFVEVSNMSEIDKLPFHVEAVYKDNLLIKNGSWKPQPGVVLKDSYNEATKHVLSLNNGSGILVFSERYNQDWTITSGSGTAEHFRVNMFFNGWAMQNVSSSVTIEYQPQKEVTVLALLSIIVIVGMVSFFTYRHLLRGYRSKH